MKDLKLEDLCQQWWFDNFRKRFSLKKKKIKVTAEAASANQEAADEFSDTIKKMRRKGICLNRFLMQTEVPYSGRRGWGGWEGWVGGGGGYLLVRKRSEHQESRQEEETNSTVFCKCSMIRTALIHKAANSRTLKGRGTPAASVLVVWQQEGLDNENTFSGLVPLMLCPWSQEVPCW